jgi:hypothetical protein
MERPLDREALSALLASVERREGYDAMRDFLFELAGRVELDGSAWALYHVVMTAY